MRRRRLGGARRERSPSPRVPSDIPFTVARKFRLTTLLPFVYPKVVLAHSGNSEMRKRAASQDYEAHRAIALMRREHGFLHDHVESLTALLRADVNRKTITDQAQRFMAISTKHFINEERAMRVSGFPDLAFHQNEHDCFVSDADDLLRNLCSSDLEQQRTSFIDDYWHWMDRHRLSDSRFDDYCLYPI